MQRAMVDSGLAIDKINTSSHQDGNDRFEVTGRFTKTKHQKLVEYLQQDARFSDYKVYACVRKPFERLVSFYFSPHRHIKKKMFRSEYYLPRTVEFNEKDFFYIVEKELPSWEYLSCSESEYIPPKRLAIIRTETMEQDIRTFLPVIRTNRSRKNVSPYREEADKVLRSAELRRAVESTQHGKDLAYFYEA